MIYNIIKISQNKKGWKVSFQDVPGERIEGPTLPNPSGFFYYPVTMSKKEAFSELKKAMIESHVEEIIKLRMSLNKLKELKFIE